MMTMEIAIKTLYLGLNPKLIKHRRSVSVLIPNFSCKTTAPFSRQTGFRAWENLSIFSPPVRATLSGIEDVGVSSSQFEDFSAASASINNGRELKVSVEVSGTATRTIFDEVFEKMVAAAQPIPGFRRVKGGKTPNIPRDILLEVLGPSKVYKQVIKKVINSTVAEFVEKEALKVDKSLRVEQSFEELEDAFEPGEKFNFDAVIQLQTD